MVLGGSGSGAQAKPYRFVSRVLNYSVLSVEVSYRQMT